MLGDLEGAPTPIEVKVFGDDADTLAEISEQVEEAAREGIDGVVDIVGVQRGNPRRPGTSTRSAPAASASPSRRCRRSSPTPGSATSATELRLADRTIPCACAIPTRTGSIRSQHGCDARPRRSDGRSVPLCSARARQHDRRRDHPERENLRQMALVTGRLEDRDLGSAVAEIQAKLPGLKLPVGYTTEVGGQYASQRQAFRELLMVFAIAAALVFIILVVQFRRFLPAVLILLAAPLSLAARSRCCSLTGTELNVSSAMGLILLVGLVVKNGIVLLDYAHRLRDEGHAVHRGARDRRRACGCGRS